MKKKNGKIGYEATKRLRHRDKAKRGGHEAQQIPTELAGTMSMLIEKHFNDLLVKNYSPSTITGRRVYMKAFLSWLVERDLRDIKDITKPILESYQRHLWRWRKSNGKPMAVSSQTAHLATIKAFFSWLTRQNYLLANPASELEMPRREKRLPQQGLTQHEIKRLFNVPDLTDPLGVRDRAILEVFYSTGIRRTELTNLELTDVNQERMTLQIRQGKGHKDRVVPLGHRAMDWIERYENEIRPKLLIDMATKSLFLTSYGEKFNPDVISRMVSKFMKKAEIGKTGSCHLLRHSCATHMLEGGADIRFIQQLLGHESLETTSIYTRVSIEQLKLVHSQSHPSET